ncbi:MAG: starvation-inducible outer membrane lipoprotein Slp [Idiomarinaceae bacterium HL-53]|nr:MAG: starvation-inducible outer membrane lipoprotein Slp [Idiomarinaceae bacterium HL-53]CUS48590.1 outer membrane lipoprotein [Idiomarinaceae bacterium HL-53]
MKSQHGEKKLNRWTQWLVVALGLMLLSGCASRLPEELRSDEKQLVSFPQLLQEPETHVGSPTRLGGLIANVQNLNESSVIEVVQFELNGYGRPHITEESPGRFRIRVNGFIDPEIYKQGREVSVFGLFSGLEAGEIGEFDYAFPVIESEGLKLWSERTERQRVDVMFYNSYPSYRFRFWGPHPYLPVYGDQPAKQPTIQQGPRQQGTRERSSGGRSNQQ